MIDIFSFDLLDAFRFPGCPACRVIAVDERRWLDSFWREGKQSQDARRRFLEGGGFCRRHAWLLHHLVAADGAGAAIADIYGALADRDLQWLAKISDQLGDGKRMRDARLLKRRKPCSACAWLREAAGRKMAFFVETLGDDKLCEAYARSYGLCFAHLAAVVEEAVSSNERELAQFLVDDWRRRLQDVRAGLAEYDRKRDYHYADEPKGQEQRSWTEVIRRYAGEDPRETRPA